MPTLRAMYLDGDKLKRVRFLKGWSQRQLSAASGVSQNTIVLMEKQSRVEGFRPATLHKLATALEIDPADLLAD